MLSPLQGQTLDHWRSPYVIHIEIMTIDCLFSRWKGENVSTTEVADVLGLIDGIQEVIVYGVSVPGMSEMLELFQQNNFLIRKQNINILNCRV